MASTVTFNSFFLIKTTLLACFFTFSNAATPKPNAFIFPIKKDHSTLQYHTSFYMGTGNIPPVKIHAVIDIGGQFLWFNCDSYASSSYRHVPCESSNCISRLNIGCISCDASPAKPGCTNDTCAVFPYNSINDTHARGGQLGYDAMVLKSTSGQRLMHQIPFACGGTEGLVDLFKGAQGMLGLAKTPVSLTQYIPSQFKIHEKIALCLPQSKTGFGSLFIGGGPYNMPHDVSNLVIKTPLVINPVSTAPAYTPGDPSDEYFIDVKSIRVDGENVSFDKSLLRITKDGVGGTKISTINPYTILHSSIYKPLAKSFIKHASARKMKRVASVVPFGVCYSSKSIGFVESVGSSVPIIDLVLDEFNSRYWRFWGANSMVKVNRNVMCFGFVDGGNKVRSSIVIGGLQLENCLLEIDVGKSTAGLSPPLGLYNASCTSHQFKN